MVGDWLVLTAAAAIPISIAVGVIIGKRSALPPTNQDIARFMNRVVNEEEMEEHERLTKFKMARNGRKTQRFDGGPNAKIARMRIRPTSRRYFK